MLAHRAVLEAAEGLTNKEAKLKMTAASVGKWRHRFVERRRPSRRASSGRTATLRRHRRRDSTDAKRRQAPPTRRFMSGAVGYGPSIPNLESVLPETSPQRDLQAVKRSVVYREGAGWPLPRPAGCWC